MIITFYHEGETRIELIFKEVPNLGDAIIVNGETAWITALGKQDLYVPEGLSPYYGDYTFERKRYFRD